MPSLEEKNVEEKAGQEADIKASEPESGQASKEQEVESAGTAETESGEVTESQQVSGATETGDGETDKGEPGKTASQDQGESGQTAGGIPTIGTNVRGEHGVSCVIEGLKAIEFVDLLEVHNPDRISGRTVANDPVTFRFLTDKNTYVMVIAATLDKKDTKLFMADFNTGDSSNVLDQVKEAYSAALTNRDKKLSEEKEKSERAAKEREEMAKAFAKGKLANTKEVETNA